jgi:N-glycosylase/DNA lyase
VDDEDDTLPLLTSYFNLPISLTALYAHWSAADPVFARRSPPFTGIRILNQPSWEALVAFICSSNNNIARIGQMVSKLCLHYGPYLGTLPNGMAGGDDGEPLHDFPSPQALAVDGVEQKLRELGFGYRARYIAQTARIITEHGDAWLDSLRNPLSPALGGHPVVAASTSATPAASSGTNDGQERSYKAAHEALLTLPGVGPKVADCVCLMGLGWAEAVPVDTHVWQIATRDYKFGGGKAKMKTFNKAVHDAVGDHFRGIWGEYAGWAQSVLFTSNLKSFAEQAAGAKGGQEAEGTEDMVKGAIKDEVEAKGEVKLEVKEELLQVVKSEPTGGDEPADLKTRMRVTKRKTVVKTELEESSGTTVANVKAITTRTSKRRRVQA